MKRQSKFKEAKGEEDLGMLSPKSRMAENQSLREDWIAGPHHRTLNLNNRKLKEKEGNRRNRRNDYYEK